MFKQIPKVVRTTTSNSAEIIPWIEIHLKLNRHEVVSHFLLCWFIVHKMIEIHEMKPKIFFRKSKGNTGQRRDKEVQRTEQRKKEEEYERKNKFHGIKREKNVTKKDNERSKDNDVEKETVSPKNEKNDRNIIRKLKGKNTWINLYHIMPF